jgi:hypothetical protein
MKPSAHLIPDVARKPLGRGPVSTKFTSTNCPTSSQSSSTPPQVPRWLIRATSPYATHGPVCKGDYLTFHKDVHQASWDFGLSFREYEGSDCIACHGATLDRLRPRKGWSKRNRHNVDNSARTCGCPLKDHNIVSTKKT